MWNQLVMDNEKHHIQESLKLPRQPLHNNTYTYVIDYIITKKEGNHTYLPRIK